MTLKNTLSFRILIWNLCRPFSSLSLCCMSCPSQPIMTLVCFAKTEIMNSPSALRSPTSCNFLSESWTGFKPTVSSSFRLLKFSLWFVFSHYSLYAFPHSLLFAREPLNFILFNLMSWVIFCEYYTSILHINTTHQKPPECLVFCSDILFALSQVQKFPFRFCPVTI